MSVQMVLLPLFVQAGLAFALLLWMASARTQALKQRQTSFKDIALGERNWGDVNLFRAENSVVGLQSCGQL
jgi:hypothetical protein